MKKVLLSLLMLLFLAATASVYSQNVKIEVRIKKTGTVTDDDGVTIDASSDDAEQENDEMDSLHDDDLDAGWEGAPDDQNILTTGLRFTGLHIPKGATIDSAFIEIWSHEGKTTEDVAEITIYAEATDNAETFTEDALITDRTATSAKVEWTVDEEWVIWEKYSTPNLKAVVQEIVNRNGWESGNAIAFVLAGENQGASDYENAREFEAFENIADPEDSAPDGTLGDGQNHPERVPNLVVYYSTSETDFDAEGALFEVPIQSTGKITDDDGVEIDASTDDAEQENDEMDSLHDDDLDAGWEGAPEDQNTLTTGLRFTGIRVPQGATIDSAFIEVWSHEGKTTEDVAEITIYAEATDNADTFTEDALITDRTPTTAQVEWTVDDEWVIWEKYSTPDLKTIVQEIVSRDGWTAGNAIAFVLAGENQGASDYENAREFEAFENIADPEDSAPDGTVGDGQNHPDRVPRLKIYFSAEKSETTAVNAIVQDSEITVYPNPTANGELNITLKNNTTSEIKLFDITGKLVKTINGNSNKVRLLIPEVKSGLYILRAVQDNNTYIQRVVIK